MTITNEIDNYIVLSKKHRKNVCEELARLVFELRKDESVECIYFAPFKNLGDITGYVLDITIVRNNFIQKEDTEEFEEYNNRHQEEMLRKYGIKIYMHTNASQDYTFFADTIPNTCYDLFQSTILYDATGKYRKIKQTIKNREGMLSYYSNLAQIEPPIVDELNYAMEEQRYKSDAEYLRKFVKTDLFQDIIDM